MRLTPCSGDTRVASTAAEKAILCALFEEFSEPDEIGINTCLILKNTLDKHVFYYLQLLYKRLHLDPLCERSL